MWLSIYKWFERYYILCDFIPSFLRIKFISELDIIVNMCCSWKSIWSAVGIVKHKNKAANYFIRKMGLFGNSRELQFGTGKLWWITDKFGEQRRRDLLLLGFRRKCLSCFEQMFTGEEPGSDVMQFLFGCISGSALPVGQWVVFLFLKSKR